MVVDTLKVKNQTIVLKVIGTVFKRNIKIIFLATSSYEVSDVDNQI